MIENLDNYGKEGEETSLSENDNDGEEGEDDSRVLEREEDGKMSFGAINDDNMSSGASNDKNPSFGASNDEENKNINEFEKSEEVGEKNDSDTMLTND